MKKVEDFFIVSWSFRVHHLFVKIPERSLNYFDDFNDSGTCEKQLILLNIFLKCLESSGLSDVTAMRLIFFHFIHLPFTFCFSFLVTMIFVIV